MKVRLVAEGVPERAPQLRIVRRHLQSTSHGVRRRLLLPEQSQAHDERIPQLDLLEEFQRRAHHPERHELIAQFLAKHRAGREPDAVRDLARAAAEGAGASRPFTRSSIESNARSRVRGRSRSCLDASTAAAARSTGRDRRCVCTACVVRGDGPRSRAVVGLRFANRHRGGEDDGLHRRGERGGRVLGHETRGGEHLRSVRGESLEFGGDARHRRRRIFRG